MEEDRKEGRFMGSSKKVAAVYGHLLCPMKPLVPSAEGPTFHH